MQYIGMPRGSTVSTYSPAGKHSTFNVPRLDIAGTSSSRQRSSQISIAEKGKPRSTVLKQRKARQVIGRKQNQVLKHSAGALTGSNDVQASTSSHAGQSSLNLPASSSLERQSQDTRLRRFRPRIQIRENRKPPAEVQADKDNFMKEWQRKKLGTHLSPKTLANEVWTLRTYQENPNAVGRFAAAIIKDAEGDDRYMADFMFALDRLRIAYRKIMRSVKKDPSLSSAELQAKAQQTRASLIDHFTQVDQSEREPYYLRKVIKEAHLVGDYVRAEVAKEGLDLDKMTIEQIEEKTRTLKYGTMTPIKSVIRLHEYLRRTRGMDKSDFNLYRRKRHMHHVEAISLAKTLRAPLFDV